MSLPWSSYIVFAAGITALALVRWHLMSAERPRWVKFAFVGLGLTLLGALALALSR